MLISLEWLKEYVDISNIHPDKLEESLILSGSNIEESKKTWDLIENIAVCEVVDIKKHPDADRLSICMAKLGENPEDTIQVLTAAKNMKVGDFIPLAKVNSTLADGTKIKKGKMRGEESNGMFCSYQELGFEERVVPKDALEGLLILDKKYPYNMDIKELLNLNDRVVEFEITPNRPDCLCVMGMAREAAATFNLDFKAPDVSIKEEHGDINGFAKVKIHDTDLCKRYVARVVTDVKIEPSPLWMQLRLMKAGVRPINNIVDITNYVLMEYSQPIHAFDLDKLENGEINVRRAKENEKIITLDGEVRELDSDILVICDKDKPAAVAGVMGGLHSGISESTKNILIEVAVFDKQNIARTVKKLGLRSESSTRFEKGISSADCDEIANRVCNLIETLNCGRVVAGVLDEYPVKQVNSNVDVRVSKVNSLLGLKLSADEMATIIKRVGADVKVVDGEILNVTSPHYRLDLLKEIDYVEEVARIYGYDNIGGELPVNQILGGKSNEQKLLDKIKEALVGAGLSEFVTYSFVSPKNIKLLNLEDSYNFDSALMIKNPLGEEFSMMRNTIIGNALNVVSYNLKRQQQYVRGFEIGHIFNRKAINADEKSKLQSEGRLVIGETEVLEELSLAIVLCSESDDFFSTKAVLEKVLKVLNLDGVKYLPNENNKMFHTGRCADITYDNKNIGVIGEIHPSVCKNFEIKKRVYALELRLCDILDGRSFDIKYKPLPKFPNATRDIAMIVDESITNSQVIDVIRSAGGKILEDIELFDIYRGEQVPKDKKSMAYALIFRSQDKTLSDEEVQKSFDKILKELESKIGAKLR